MAQDTTPATLPRILRRKSVEEIVGLRGGSLDRLIHSGAFPAPFKLNPADPRSRAIGWDSRDVSAWIDQRREMGRAA